MSKLFYKVIIEDMENDKCTDAELEALVRAFEYTVKKMATTPVRKAWYELKDYATSSKKGIANFSLELERKDIRGQEQWHGIRRQMGFVRDSTKQSCKNFIR